MNIICTSLLGLMAVAVKITSLLTINKLFAIYIGPAGYAIIGQFQNAITVLTALGSVGITTGVTKYTAEHNNDLKKQYKLWTTAVICCLIGSFFVATLLIIFSLSISDIFLKNKEFSSIINFIGFTLPILVLNYFLLAILNGKKKIKIFVAANILNSLSSVLAVLIGLWIFGLQGGLIGLVLGNIVSLIFILINYKKIYFKNIQNIKFDFDWNICKQLSGFTLMAIATCIVGPSSQIIIRNIIIDDLGIISAGYWEAMCRISGALIMLITTPLSIYFLPKIAEIHNVNQIKIEILSTYKLLLPAAILVGVLIIIFSDIIIKIMFTNEFYPMKILFIPQILGDIMRIAAWLLSFYLIAKARTIKFILTEITLSLSFILIVFIAINKWDLVGVSIAYAINNGLYLIILILIVMNDLKIKKLNDEKF